MRISAHAIGPLLGTVRQRFGVSLNTVADRLGLNEGIVASAELGGFPFGRSEIVLFLRACGVPDDYLVEEVLKLAGDTAKKAYQPDCADPECRENQQAWTKGGGGVQCKACGGSFRHFDPTYRGPAA